MQYSNLTLSLAAGLLSCLISSSTMAANVVLIANPAFPVNTLSKTQVSDLYLGKPISIAKVSRVAPYNQAPNSSAYQQFYQSLLGWGVNQVNSYWSSLVFSGQAQQPPVINGDAAAIALVEHSSIALAYVDSSALHGLKGQVKVLYGDAGAYQNPVSTQQTPKIKSPKAAPQKIIPKKIIQAKKTTIKKKLAQELKAINHPEKMPGIAANIANSTLNYSPSHASAKAGNTESVWKAITSHFQLQSYANNPAVRHEILFFADHPAILRIMLQDSKPYIAYVYQQTQKRGMPAEFALLPMIESGYDPFAYSGAGAAGLWQMMPGTASSYGLEINWWYDARRDLITSTNAALNYLVRLHSNMGNWLLAAAAYNAGQGAVEASIAYNRRAHRATDYWNLPLPYQTRAYVPKLLAIATIIAHPKRYGIKLPYLPVKPFFTTVTLKSQIDLAEASSLSGVSIDMLKRLNPGMRRWATSPDGDFTLLLPNRYKARFLTNLAAVRGKTHISWQYHEVRRGESLGSIARNYHTTLVLLRHVNNIKNNTVHAGDSLLVPLYLNHTYQAPTQAATPQLPVLPTTKVVSKPAPATPIQTSTITPANITPTNILSNQINAKNASDRVNVEIGPSANKTAVDSKPLSKHDSFKNLLNKIYNN